MKYWRGYLVALIFAVGAWALLQFAASHTVLMDMVYPYMTRLVQTSLAQWSSNADFCIWQVMVLLFGAGVAASVVLMVVLKWNPIQWFGWVMATVSIVMFLNAGMQGMNQYTGSIATDLRFENSDVTVKSVEHAAQYYLQQAEALAPKVKGKSYDFDELNKQAADGFETLTYEESYPIFAGSTLPVKELSWSGYYKGRGMTGTTIALTGEAAVNTKTPEVMLPYAICREMCSRMSISREPDINFAAVLACIYNEDPRFQYAGYLMAYWQCIAALEDTDATGAQPAIDRLSTLPRQTKDDLQDWEKFIGRKSPTDPAGQLLSNWYLHILDAEKKNDTEKDAPTFDPTDVTDPRISGLVE